MRRRTLAVAAAGLFATALSIAADARPRPIVSGSALEELRDTPPAPPAGFDSRAEAMAAVAANRLPLIDFQRPVPPTVTARRDVVYGNVQGRKLLANVYSPKQSDGPVPGLIFIHGGAWRSGRKEDYHYYGTEFAQHGFVVASISYRLVGKAPYPAAVEDAKCAVRWMRANAQFLGVDPDRIGVVGGSAGGHLALMVAYTPHIEELEGTGGWNDVSSEVQAVVDIYGVTDFTEPFAIASPLVGSFMGVPYKGNEALWQQASPLTHVDADVPPTLILHGTIDGIVPISQSDELADRLDELGVPYVYDRLPGWTHAMDIAQPVNDRVVWFATRFLNRYLRE